MQWLIVCMIFLAIGEKSVFGQWATSGNNIYNTNSANVGIGFTNPTSLLHAAKSMAEPAITVQNLGGTGGASFSMIDNLSGASWKFKATGTGGFKIRDNANGFDVISIESNSAGNMIYINAADNVGIGTSTPSSKLEVNGDSKINGLTVGRGNGNVGSNTCFGNQALASNTSGIDNIAIGNSTLFLNQTGNKNIAIGNGALYASTGSQNIACGFWAMNNNSSGSYNTAAGYTALFSNQDGDYNTAFGAGALSSNISADGSTAIGYYALAGNTGYGNVGAGQGAGQNSNSTNGTFIGTSAYNSSGSYIFNSTALGAGADVTSNNAVRIGNSSVTSIGGYAGWTTFPSDKRFKKNVSENVPGLEFICQLHPVTYNVDVTSIEQFVKSHKNLAENGKTLDPDVLELERASRTFKENVVYSGFIAQDVEAAAKSAGYSFSGVDVPQNENGIYGLRYAEFTIPMTKAIQELNAKVEEQQKVIELLMQKIEELENR